jgi:hypothetical protein
MTIHSIKLDTAGLSKVGTFYQQTLRLEPLAAAPGEVRFRLGLSELIFTENPGFTGIYHFAFNIPCNQIREAITWLTQCGISLIADAQGETCIDFPDWDAEATYFFDPAGNIAEFIARRDLHNESARPFGPASLLAISEIGIVTKDVMAWNARMTRDFGVLPFSKSEPGPNFSALGTDSGLFIVVPEGRKWFLTDIPATQGPLEVRFSQGEKEYTIS